MEKTKRTQAQPAGELKKRPYRSSPERIALIFFPSSASSRRMDASAQGCGRPRSSITVPRMGTSFTRGSMVLQFKTANKKGQFKVNCRFTHFSCTWNRKQKTGNVYCFCTDSSERTRSVETGPERSLASGSPFRLTFVFFWHKSIGEVRGVGTSLLSGKTTSNMFVFFLPRFVVSCILKDLWFLLVGNGVYKAGHSH